MDVVFARPPAVMTIAAGEDRGPEEEHAGRTPLFFVTVYAPPAY